MYLKWNEKTITDFSNENINSLYNEGFLFTREHIGSMYQTRSLRIDLSKFELSSENRRILRKIDDLRLQIVELPYDKYDWTIGKLGKDFYEIKFGKNIFSANKIKELITSEKSNFNTLFVYTIENTVVGYAIIYKNKEILHYSYPFYRLDAEKNIGIGMMLESIMQAKISGCNYVYLGSAKDQAAKYKLQFSGLEWFDGKTWQTDLEELKNILK